MKAAVRTTYGPPEVLQVKETPTPIPNEKEVLVRVHSTTVNRTDCAVLRAKPFIMRFFIGLINPKKTVTGTDFAGVVEAVGNQVSLFQPGDRVFGFNDNGLSSHAEYTTVSEEENVAIIPTSLSLEEAVASLEGAHYAYNFINKVRVERGQNVLVNGATGAIGLALLQLVKYYGATVTAVGNTPNLELLKSLGANRIIDYTKQDFTKEEDEQYDFIFDAVGKSSYGKCKPLLKSKGTYISSELGKWAQNPFLALITPISGGKRVVFPIPLDVKASIRFISQLVEEGKFKPVIDRSYPLEHIADAFRYVEKGQKTGNVLLTMKQ